MLQNLRIATRNSPLALWQANHIKNTIQSHYPATAIQILPLTTSGDKLSAKGDKVDSKFTKGTFTIELEEALTSGKADIAVHSLKDVPVHISNQFTIKPVAQPDDHRDILISKTGKALMELPSQSIIGTISMRRSIQINNIRADLTTKPIRGNLQTRIEKLHAKDYDAIMLAAAGIHRLHLTHMITEYFPTNQIIPSPCQGVLAIQTLSQNTKLIAYLDSCLHDEFVEKRTTTERLFCQLLGGSCNLPIAAYAEIKEVDNEIILHGMIGDPDTNQAITTSTTGKDPRLVAEQCVSELINLGAKPIIEKLSYL